MNLKPREYADKISNGLDKWLEKVPENMRGMVWSYLEGHAMREKKKCNKVWTQSGNGFASEGNE